MKKSKRRYITLLEIMIAMFLIAMITGVIAYNYRGSLEAGKAFKSKAGIERIETILNLKAAQNPEILDNLGNDWERYIKESPLVKDPDQLIRDGWGTKYVVEVQDGSIKVVSQNYLDYLKREGQGG